DHGDAVAPVELGQAQVDLAGPGRVELGHGLVDHDHLGAHREHRGERHQVGLAAGELPDEAVAQVGYPQLLERLVGALAVIRVPEVQGAEGDLVTDRRLYQLVLEVLVDVADTAGELRDAGVPGIDPLHVHGAGEVAVPVVRDQA